MASDAHAHPYDLLMLHPDAELDRQRLGIACIASAWSDKEFSVHEQLSDAVHKNGSAPLYCGFAVHPQLPARHPDAVSSSLQTLETLLSEKKLDVMGELGFDLFDTDYKQTEQEQDKLFLSQLGWAVESSLPLVLHVRRAMHKIFAYSTLLAKCPSVLFHSYSGTLGEAESLLRRGINAYFSFGTVLLLNHKKAIEVYAKLPEDRLLFETDAPYQALRGQRYSSWNDLSLVIEAAARIHRNYGTGTADAKQLEQISDNNFLNFLTV